MFRMQIFVREALYPNGNLPEQQQEPPIPPLGIIGELDTYSSFDAVDPWNDIGSWTLEVPSKSPQANWFVEGRGIVVFREGSEEPIFSGPITSIEKSWEASEGGSQSLLKVTGKDDKVFLAERLAWTNPGWDIHWANDEIRWQAPDAPNVGEVLRTLLLRNYTFGDDRSVSKLYISREAISLPGDESAKSILLRFNQISDEIKKMTSVFGFRITCLWHASPDLIGDAVDSGPGPGILVRIEPVEDLTNVVQFGPHLGNLKSYSYKLSAPTATRAVVGTQRRKYKEFDIRPTYDDSGLMTPEHISGYTEVETEKEGPERYYSYHKNDTADPDWWGIPEETPEDMEWTLPWAERGLTASEVLWGVSAERFLDESSIDWQWAQDPAEVEKYSLDPPVWSKQFRAIRNAVEKFHVDNGPTATIEFEPVEAPEQAHVFEDYGNGDLITVHIDSEAREEAVREIRLSASASEAHRVVPVAGTDGSSSAPYLYRQVRELWNEIRGAKTPEDLSLVGEETPVPAFGFTRVEEED